MRVCLVLFFIFVGMCEWQTRGHVHPQSAKQRVVMDKGAVKAKLCTRNNEAEKGVEQVGVYVYVSAIKSLSRCFFVWEELIKHLLGQGFACCERSSHAISISSVLALKFELSKESSRGGRRKTRINRRQRERERERERRTPNE